MTQPQHAQNEPERAHLLTKPQACAWLSVSRATLDRLIHARELDIVRVGTGRGSVRITERALMDYTRRRTTKGVANLPPREQGQR
jgi:excisionase family DNA binding protein